MIKGDTRSLDNGSFVYVDPEGKASSNTSSRWRMKGVRGFPNVKVIVLGLGKPQAH